MSQEPQKPIARLSVFQKFDSLIKKFIPSFNVRAVIYISVIFALAVYLQVWRISAPKKPTDSGGKQNQETVIADDKYWNSTEYKDKIKNQTVDTFTTELSNWLEGKNQEFLKRKFEDMFYINRSLTPLTGGELSAVVPQNFNYLENGGKARYQYAKVNGFLADKPALVPLGKAVCDQDEKTEKDTGIELFDFRYASMPKLSSLMASKLDWKIQIGNQTFNVYQPYLDNKDYLKNRTSENQPAGLFSFLIFHDLKTNRIFMADNIILENNAVDSEVTLGKISSHADKSPKIYFKYGYGGCQQINSQNPINYGQPD